MPFKALFSLITFVTLGVSAVVVLILVAFNPSQLGPIGVTFWFLALWAASGGILGLVVFMIKSQFRREDTSTARLYGSLRQGLLVTGGAVICLALASLRQLSPKDVILIVILGALTEFYFRTRR